MKSTSGTIEFSYCISIADAALRRPLQKGEQTAMAALLQPKKPARRIRGREFFAGSVKKGWRTSLHVALALPAAALGLNLLIELLNHKGLTGLGLFLANNPLAFLVNFLIILLTLTPCLLFRRRAFCLTLLSLVWAVSGVANGIILQNRMTPFTTADLTVFSTGFEILPTYFTKFQMVLLGAVCFLILVGLTLLFLKGPRAAAGFRRRLLSGLLAAALAGGFLVISIKFSLLKGILSPVFSNLAYAYEDYGFAYCFANTWLNTGIRTPKNYSAADMERIRTMIEKNSAALPQEQARTDVNIVYVQLESFFDPQQIKGLEFNQDPVPNWHKLQDGFTTGYLTTPVVGAGTANTEMEVLTGMRAWFFGPGEYPYKTVLKNCTAESAAYILKDLGYGAHAIHNHRGAFYGRNQVYKNLGFDTFTSLEYISHFTETPKGWCKDDVLTDEIQAALDSTDTPDFVFAVSVQGHGKYPSDPVLEDPEIQVAAIADEDQRYSIEYYANQIHEMDAFIGQLIQMLEQRGEPAVLVLYGDHLPALQMEEDNLQSHSLYKTEYLIWDNLSLKKQDQHIKAYQLTARVFALLGIHEGTFPQFHQSCQQESTYLKDLRKLQYDQLYGANYLSGGQPAYQPSDLQMGVRPIQVTDYIQLLDSWYIVGENFTQYSKATVDGEILETEFLNGHLLRVLDDEMIQEVSSPDDIKISQVEAYREVLSVTE